MITPSRDGSSVLTLTNSEVLALSPPQVPLSGAATDAATAWSCAWPSDTLLASGSDVTVRHTAVHETRNNTLVVAAYTESVAGCGGPWGNYGNECEFKTMIFRGRRVLDDSGGTGGAGGVGGCTWDATPIELPSVFAARAWGGNVGGSTQNRFYEDDDGTLFVTALNRPHVGNAGFPHSSSDSRTKSTAIRNSTTSTTSTTSTNNSTNNSTSTVNTAELYSMLVLYASLDDGKSFAVRGNLSKWALEGEVVSLGRNALVATARFQTQHWVNARYDNGT